MGLGLERAGRGASLTRAAIAALLVIVVAGCQSPAIAPTGSQTATPVAVASPTAPPSTAAPSPGSGIRHVNDVLGFAVTLPPPWRVSGCLSGVTREGTWVGQDVFTWRTIAEEHDLGGAADAGGSGAMNWIITIAAELSTLAPPEYARNRGGSVGDKIDMMTIDGRPATRVSGGFGGTWIYVANAGRMYTLTFSTNYEPGPKTTDVTLTFDSITRSFAFVTPSARPTPSTTPTLTPAVATLVDAIAAAFAASDADRIRDLMPPTCWVQTGSYQSSPEQASREKITERLRTAFAQGLKVTVESRPIRTAAPFVGSPFWVWSTWSPYGPTPPPVKDIVLLGFDQRDGRWYWTKALHYADDLRRP